MTTTDKAPARWASDEQQRMDDRPFKIPQDPPTAPLPFGGQPHWIWSDEGIDRKPQCPHDHYRVRFFRRAFDGHLGDRMIAHVSADSRYVFWCNGQYVARGPARGDVAHQFYDTHDITPLLHHGRNVLAVLVLYFGDVMPRFATTGAPCGIMTACPGFVLDAAIQNPRANTRSIHTDSQWKVHIDSGAHGHDHCEGFGTYCGLTERFDARHYPWGWLLPDFDDSGWSNARELTPARRPDTVHDTSMPHRLVPRLIPAMQHTPHRLGQPLNAAPEWEALLSQGQKLVIEPNTTFQIAIKADEYTTGMSRLRWSGGHGAVIRLTYAEAITKDGRKQRGPEPVGQIQGVYDEITCDGGPNRLWESWHYRAYLYVRMSVTTGATPLTLHECSAVSWHYPLDRQGFFESDDPFHARLMDVCWRTVRCCSHEAFDDGPYYEQMSYAGDMAVVADLLVYLAGDLRLIRQGAHLFDWSRNSDGLTMSRYPSRQPQVIPFWSQFWIYGIHRHWWYTGEIDEARSHLNGIESVLRWFEARREGPDGLVGRLDQWCVMDWSPDWGTPGDAFADDWGVPPGTYHEASAIASFFHVWCLQMAADLFQATGQSTRAEELRRLADQLAEIAHTAFWDPTAQLYRDRKDVPKYSQMTNAFALLSDVADPALWPMIAPRLVDNSLCRAAYFGQHYVFHALAKARRFDLFYPRLASYRELIDRQCMTTMPEDPVHQRSDCHAWSAGAAFHLLHGSLGVRATAPGFAEIEIAPQPGPLNQIRGHIPTPRGLVHVSLRKANGAWTLEARVPDGTPTRVRLPGGTTTVVAAGGAFTLAEPVGASAETVFSSLTCD